MIVNKTEGVVSLPTNTAPPKDRDIVVQGISMPRELKRRMALEANRRNWPVSLLAREAITQWLAVEAAKAKAS